MLRCGKSCRLRWINYLRPDLKRGAISESEEKLIIELHARFGNKWSKIASNFPGRTDNEIKNHWNTRIKKRLKKTQEKNLDEELPNSTHHIDELPNSTTDQEIEKKEINLKQNETLLCNISNNDYEIWCRSNLDMEVIWMMNQEIIYPRQSFFSDESSVNIHSISVAGEFYNTGEKDTRQLMDSEDSNILLWDYYLND